LNFKDRDLTSGSISKSIWHLAIPMMAANILQSAFSLIDMMWVSRIEGIARQSIAAVALTQPIIFIIFTIIMGIAASTTAMVARSVGARDQKQAEDVAFQSLILSTFASLAVAALGLVFSGQLFSVMGADAEVVQLSGGYLRIILGGSMVMFLLFIISAVLRGAGDAYTPMVILVVSVIINALLDPLLIFGVWPFPKLDVNGAALATVISRGIGCAIGFYFLFRNKVRIKLSIRDFRIHAGIMWKLIKIGMPNSAMMTMRSLMTFAVMWIVVGFGTSAVAAYGIGGRIYGLILFPAFGLAMAPVTLVGQNLGAGKPDRAERSSWLTVFYLSVLMGVSSVIIFIFARPLISFFNETPDVVSTGVSFLRVTCPFYIATAFGLTLGRSLVGAGDTVSPAVMTFISLWLIQVPLAYFLSRPDALGITGVWWAISAATVAQAVMTTLWFKTDRSKKKKI